MKKSVIFNMPNRHTFASTKIPTRNTKNPKFEARNPKQYRNSNDQNSKLFWEFEISDLEFVSKLGIRYSNFISYLCG